MATVSGTATVSVTQGGITTNLGAATDIIPMFIETKDFDAGEPEALKFVEEIVVEMSGSHSIELYVKHRRHLSAGFEEDGPYVLYSTSDPVFAWTPGDNYVRLKFSSPVTVSRWKLGKFYVYGKMDSKRF